MLLHMKDLRKFALGIDRPHAPFPQEVVLDLSSLSETLEWCTAQFGPPANQPVTEGFPGYYKVFQEHNWMWSPQDRGYLFFESISDAVMAKLACGGHSRERATSGRNAYFETAGGARGLLEREFPENIYVPLSALEHFDFAYAHAWCEQQLGPPRFHIISVSAIRPQLEVRRIANKGRWCYFVNTYYFARARDAMLFRLSVE